ncbi:MAG: hypothetical protein A2172_02915 [Candidatus Woykebacteria bacterium RBG_13_40_15]|uniref:Polysaccharide biosynthesis protein C-terminal domain-containing protein n=1 Tax=Candidatus Woykebacteria bacterium RBG_13_40_15 TaxID=1802593 RepID=A0A1G1W660_9BACT|nr:MAG: hypothetical protein A2172_02915 [Candidatus Woykebacteria bacterium RBG_13_40_15]
MLETFRSHFPKIYSLVFSRTAVNTGLVFSGNILAAIVTFFTIAVISRTLGPASFGIFSLATALATLIAGFTDFGLGSSLVRFFNLNLERDSHKAKIFVNLIFKLELIIGLLILIVGMLLVGPLSHLLSPSNPGQLVFPLRLAIIGGFGLSIGAFIPAAFQTYEQFTRLSLFPIVINTFRFLSILGLILIAKFTLINALWVYALVPLLGFFIGLLLVKKDYLYNKSTAAEQRSVFSEVFHFSKWIMLSFFATSLAGRLDILMLSHFRQSSEVGIYSAAFQLSTIFPLFISAITSVLYPKASKIERTKEKFFSYIKKTFSLSVAFVVLLLPLIILAPYVISIVFGAKYSQAVPSFAILTISYMIATIANPISLVIFSLHKNAYITLTNYIQLALVFGLNLLLIPRMGSVGAALTFLISTIFGSLAVIIYSIYISNKLPELSTADKQNNF